MEIRIPTSQVIVRIQYNNICQMFITGPAIQYKIIIISFFSFKDFFPDPMQLLVYRTRVFLAPRRDTVREDTGYSAFWWDIPCLCCSLLQPEYTGAIR